MPLSSTIWQDGLGDPESGPGKEFEKLRQRRVHVRAEVRAAGLAEQEADRQLAATQRETRLLRAEKHAMNSKLAAAASAASLVAAEDQATKAAARVRDAQDAADWLDNQAEHLLQKNADQLLHELSAAAEQAQQELVTATRHARAAVTSWLTIARRQEVVLQAAGGAHRDDRAPVEALRQVTDALAKVEAGLPPAAVGTQVAA